MDFVGLFLHKFPAVRQIVLIKER